MCLGLNNFHLNWIFFLNVHIKIVRPVFDLPAKKHSQFSINSPSFCLTAFVHLRWKTMQFFHLFFWSQECEGLFSVLSFWSGKDKASSMKRIIDQECFSCKEIPLQDGFSRNQIACPEMTYLICEGCVLLIGSNN